MALDVSDRPGLRFNGDVRMLEFAAHVDARGRLIEMDFSAAPFPVRRAFAIASVPAGTTRGGHRHRDTEQILCCVAGSVEVELRRGAESASVTLAPGAGGLYIAPGVWSSQRYAGEGSVLVVLASEPFDPHGYDTGY